MPNRRPLAVAATLLATAALAAAGCGSSDESGGDAELTVTATTTQVADLVREVGGDRVDVNQLLEPNSDPHAYEPRPSDVASISDSEVLFRSGGDLDEWLAEVVENAGGEGVTVDLSESVELREGGHDHGDEEHAEDEHGHEDGADHADEAHSEEEHGHEEESHAGEEDHAADDHGHDHEDPHWWQDPRNAIAAVAAIEAALIEADPDGAATYEANASAYVERLETLDSEVAACIEQIPAAQRKLVTTHDALGYYADRYDLEIVGALIPSLSTAAQPSARDTRELVDQIGAADVQAIFPESSLNPKLEQAVANETGATVGEALWADTLGPEGSGGATYVESIQANTEAIAAGLTGGTVSCDFTD
ncbi:MAG: zinc ABC transporter solute-binding protein [Solirubrobacterales bacterium]|nr:zinc ABC transporter solute-binding protein [Solirubrobacterales bacterium]